MDTKIFLTNLAQYNNGNLKGEWLTLPMAKETLQEAVERILGKDEEFFITDFESDFDIEEYQNLEELNNFVTEYSKLDEYEKVGVRFLINQESCSFEEALKEKDNMTIYEADSYRDLAYEFVEEGLFGDVPKHLENYIDYDAIARDLEMDYYEFDGYYINRG